MNCRESRELIQDLLDDRLDAGGRRAIEGHLSSCAPCASEFDALRRTRHLLRSLPRESAPPAFAARTMAAIARAPGPRALRVPRPLAWIGVLAAAAALLLAVLLFSPDPPADDRSETPVADAKPVGAGDRIAAKGAAKDAAGNAPGRLDLDAEPAEREAIAEGMRRGAGGPLLVEVRVRDPAAIEASVRGLVATMVGSGAVEHAEADRFSGAGGASPAPPGAPATVADAGSGPEGGGARYEVARRRDSPGAPPTDGGDLDDRVGRPGPGRDEPEVAPAAECEAKSAARGSSRPQPAVAKLRRELALTPDEARLLLLALGQEEEFRAEGGLHGQRQGAVAMNRSEPLRQIETLLRETRGVDDRRALLNAILSARSERKDQPIRVRLLADAPDAARSASGR